MSTHRDVADLTGRVLLASLFLVSGIGKVGSYADTAAWMTSGGVPGALLPLVIALEVGGGIALVAGWKLRWFAAALAAFTVLAGVLFHVDPQDEIQTLMLLKNLSIAGGLVLLALHGPGCFSLDARVAGRRDARLSHA